MSFHACTALIVSETGGSRKISGGLRSFATQSIYEFLKEAGNIHVKWDMMRLRAATSGEVPELAVYFEVPVGKIRPFILLEITNYDDKNNPVLCGNIYVDTERIKLNLVRDLGQLS